MDLPESEPLEQETEGEQRLSESKALIPLLLTFAVIVVVIFAALLRGDSFAHPSDSVAERPYGPADFPKIFGKDTSLVGLDEVAGPTHATPVPPPPFSEGLFPCSDCHDEDQPPNPTRRPMVEEHDDIVLRHDEENRWCLDCHDANNRDRLKLASGALIEFTESYKLCGQCHGTQYRDWKTGIHGKRTGYWNGAKRYLLCVHCHYPHSPRFKKMAPLPPPVRPQFLSRDRGVVTRKVSDD